MDWFEQLTGLPEQGHEATRLQFRVQGRQLQSLANAERGVSNTLLLTRLGGGVFGNADPWIDAAIHRALRLATGFALQLGLVDYREPHPSTRALLRAFCAAPGA